MEKVDEQREQLRQYFLTLPEDQQVNGWDHMWQKSITPWDRKQSNPALVDTLKEKTYLVDSPFRESSGARIRKKVLVPGCGRGHDVLLFASYGFDAYGLDASSTAVEAAKELAVQQENVQIYPVQNSQNGRGEAKFIEADFFSNAFLSHTQGTDSDRTFDLIYDYTFLCALPPSMRPQWAARMSDLLAPDGRLLCTEFPLGKAPKLGGPPHGLESGIYEELFAKPGEREDAALVRVEHLKPQRTFEGQEKSTMVSVWRHRKT